jgi:D-3-phosphoglycerate dehydrogenase / 2-oxoglutarate reductase
MPRTILVSESSNFSPAAAKRLEQAGRVIWADLDRPHLLAAVSDASLLWVRLRHQIDRQVIDAAPRLQAIASPTTGLNHIDLAYAERRGIRVISLRGETAFLEKIFATAEHTLALILSLVRHVPESTRHVTEGGWNRDAFRGRELHGKTAGVVGLGRVGRMVAGYLQALGMRVLAADPALKESPSEGIGLVALKDLLAQSDLVTLHASLTDQTQGFFGEGEFKAMKNGAWFVNTARGELIQEGALLAGLAEGRIAGAALDVLCDERSSGMKDHPLVAYARTHANLLITPHIGGCTLESMEQTEEFLADKVVTFLQSHHEEICVAGHRKDRG